MKKKVKLFTTIASLCLAVALMAFGVYAATNATYKVSGSISFTSTNVDGTWALKSVSVAGGKFAAGEGVAVDGLSLTTLANVHELPIVTVDSQDDATGSYTCVITIVATYTASDTSDEATIKAVKDTTGTENGVTVDYGSSINVAQGATGDVTVKVTFTGKNSKSANGAYAIEFQAAKKA